MSEPGQRPLESLAAAVKAAGGVVAVARVIGTSVTHLSNMVTGQRPLGKGTASRLRGVLPDVPAEVWLELLAPIAETEQEAQPEAGA